MIYRLLILSYLSYGICVWGCAAKSSINWQTTCSSKMSSWTDLLYAQWCSCYSSFHSIKDFTCKYDLFWHACESHAWYLEKTSPFAYQSSFHYVKWKSWVQHIFRKKLSRKFSNALFRELERYCGIKFPQTREIYLNQSLRKQFVDFYLRLFQIGMTMLKSAPWVLKFSSWLILTHSFVYF